MTGSYYLLHQNRTSFSKLLGVVNVSSIFIKPNATSINQQHFEQLRLNSLRPSVSYSMAVSLKTSKIAEK